MFFNLVKRFAIMTIAVPLAAAGARKLSDTLEAKRGPSRGTRALYQVRIGAQTRQEADQLCAKVRDVGGACMVLRNNRA